MFKDKPFRVIYEFQTNTAPSHRPEQIEWDTNCVTIWADSYAQVKRICRSRYGAFPVIIEPLWVAPEVGEC
jgi:hypothetical protein